ncbi:unnamed protein product [Menidia menidia]|uniref:(Atlantic silverside) hypothetical protein n=1 Tax=Menidia menidia TaxID=238744 RepID=A0A8S4AT17_9TELE|nr:unnamed protein product [Menidia menidia]
MLQTERQFARVACIRAEFYMKNGIVWSVEEGYGPVTERQFARVACIRAEFYMKNGIVWSVEEGYGPVVPI